MLWTLEDWARKRLFSRWPFGSHIPVPFILTGKNSGKHSPPVGKCSHVDAASSLLMSFLSLPLPCFSSPACANRSWMTPMRTICTWVREPLPSATLAHAATPAQSPGELSIRPLRLASPTLSCSSGAPHRRLYPRFKAGGGEEFLLGLYLGVLFIRLLISVECLLCAGYCSRH